MTLRIALQLTLLAVVCLAGQAAGAEGQAEVLARLERAASQVRTIQSDFVQTKRLQIFASEVVSRGVMYLEKPDRLRWEYREPASQGFVVDGEEAFRWNEFTDGVERFSISEDVATRLVAEQLLLWAGVDLKRLGRTFTLEVEQAEPPVLSLRPRSEKLGGYLERIRVSFGEDLRAVQRVEILEKDGDSTELLFENVQLNEEMPQGAFSP